MSAGRTLGERYVLEGLLGRGGMAAVYRARDTRLERDVAVKVLAEDLKSDPTYLARFEKEAKLSAQLRHPNLIEVFDVALSGEDERYLVMELLDGESLAERVGQTGLPVAELLSIALQITSGVRVLHAANVVHRDLSANNVMLVSLMGSARRDHVKVLDLGIAKAEGAKTLTEPGSFVGTLESMSPEQIRGDEVDARADVYALGVLFYRMASGAAPFSGEAATLIYQHLDARPAPLATRATHELPEGLAALVERCLEKEPAARFASAEELHLALAGIAAGRPVASPAPPVVPDLAVPEPPDVKAPGPGEPSRGSQVRPVGPVGVVGGARSTEAGGRSETVLEPDDDPLAAPLELEAVARKTESLVAPTPLACASCGAVLQVSTSACPSCGESRMAALTPFNAPDLRMRPPLPAWLAPLGAFPVGVTKRVAAYSFGGAVLLGLFFRGMGGVAFALVVVSIVAIGAAYVRSRLDEEA